ncbi:fumarylacetoacetate hydrolase family protein [Paenibacillus illinoisensis]|uniref:Fumarylacetoacetate hydrolase n=1 Tax=Paenibacillus illinoisensis TaxID=59845 RepID=A0A2W0C1B4_9BACL|nr:MULTISPECIES: fumarylacetoacetate hydrolase family protein [Paenibacillus]MBY0215537.1 fumarylacetoacetate hydrolase family protein [Paenibacillus illinoisensis]MCM3203501.1 fumarylacetoacetate hydrolase family protein [Paenibacillus illinoisensis]PYY25720.1 Fumarylacetoacetate hydrolase [Paenibacillus illinoisensis]WJH29172.1 fumarylacetoacetate hydrolase family protein [Paenibacillus sp. CC-CFT742]
MRIIRFLDGQQKWLAAVTDDEQAYRLPQADFMTLIYQAREKGVTPVQWIESALKPVNKLTDDWTSLHLITPVDAPEVWAAGVTYQRSREARNYEATDGKLDAETFYDKVYDAERPEIFFKSTAARTVGPNEAVTLRSDSTWQIPEPELGLVLAADGSIVGYIAGNDMSCRDIEGENPLYLPQAKIWRNSCSIGPAIRLAETVKNPYEFSIVCQIYRDESMVVKSEASTSELNRKLDELVSFLARDNDVYDGTVLLTGTSIVPPNDFTLEPGDRIEISISDIGTLINPVISN